MLPETPWRCDSPFLLPPVPCHPLWDRGNQGKAREPGTVNLRFLTEYVTGSTDPSADVWVSLAGWPQSWFAFQICHGCHGPERELNAGSEIREAWLVLSTDLVC